MNHNLVKLYKSQTKQNWQDAIKIGLVSRLKAKLHLSPSQEKQIVVDFADVSKRDIVMRLSMNGISVECLIRSRLEASLIPVITLDVCSRMVDDLIIKMAQNQLTANKEI